LASSQEERRSILHSYIEPTAEDRRNGRRTPTAAHRALADLIAEGFIRVVVTTNFDRLLESALRERGVEATIVASVDALAGAEPIAHSACYILKLHGDYKDARILNTDAELQEYPSQYDGLLDRIFDEYGLIVCGWSGEWDHALRAALLRAPNRRYPVFWAARGTLGLAAEGLANHRAARLVSIEDADRFFSRLRERITSLSQSQQKDPSSIELLISTTKRYVGKQEHQIQLHDLLEQETTKLLELSNSDSFSPSAAWNIDNFGLRLRQYESMAEPLARVAGVLGRWGDRAEFSLILDIVRSLHRAAQKFRSGINFYLSIRLYSAVLIFTAYGLGLVRAQRWQLLHELFVSSIDMEYQEPKKTVEVLLPTSWDGGGRDVWNQLEKQNLKTPLSDHLLKVFTAWGSSFATLTPDFELLFEQYEILGAFAYLETNSKEELDDALKTNNDYIWMPLGRSGWHESNSDKILTGIQNNPAKAELVKAGFAKGSLDLFDSYVANFRRIALRMRWM
jgi:SIR2-like protein